MKAIREAADQDLQWIDKKVGLIVTDEFELRSGDEVLAMLHAREKGTDWTFGWQLMKLQEEARTKAAVAAAVATTTSSHVVVSH
jgi:hypothetical protein